MRPALVTAAFAVLAKAGGLLPVAPAAAAPLRVVVYPDRATVTRTESVACAEHKVVAFAGLPPGIDTASLRAAVGGGTLEGLRWEMRTREAAFGKEAQALEDGVRKLDAEITLVTDQRARDEASSALAAGYSNVARAQIQREMAEAAPNVAAWSAALEGVLAERLRASQELAVHDGKLRAFGRRREELLRRQGEVGEAGARRELVAEVIATCPAGKTASVELTYLVGGAGWSPAYEARAAADGASVELVTWATVRQTTGEDWAGARLVLSTAVPRQNATPPDTVPLRVWADERTPPRKVLVSRAAVQEHAEAGRGPGSDTDSRMRMIDQGLSVQIEVPESTDIPGDGTPARVLVSRSKLKSALRYRAAPKMLPFVFRVADLTNTVPFPLLPGPLDVFRANGFVGRQNLARIPVGGPFTVSFGLEESVRVRRTVVDELQRDKGLLGGTRQYRFSYRIEIENYLGRAEQIEVAEHIPVSELDDVKVVVDKNTTGGYALRPEDGIVTWKLAVKNGEKKAVDLAFHIDAPSSYEQ